MNKVFLALLTHCILSGSGAMLVAAEVATNEAIDIWPGLAPGETETTAGTTQPFREHEKPPVTRVVKVRRPTLQVFLADNPNGTGVLVLPGGGFMKVVPDKEGSELAPRLNSLGISVFVLTYRTNESKPKSEPSWKRPAQDAQRSLRYLHASAAKYNLDPARIGVVAFSAGGQVGAILHTADKPFYESSDESSDEIDEQPFRPAFSLLIYPWQIFDTKTDQLMPAIQVSKHSGPAFIVHTHDDNSTSLGAVMLYAALKKANVPAELHVFQNGGHGYGTRQVKNSVVHTWVDRAIDWLSIRKLATQPK